MKHKILLVDDNQDILESLTFILEDEGYAVLAVTKGEEVYRSVASFSPDVILLDVLLSGSDGREICKKLKADPNTKAIPVIMMSAHPTSKVRSLEIGADAFIEKPFEMDKLLKTLSDYTT